MEFENSKCVWTLDKLVSCYALLCIWECYLWQNNATTRVINIIEFIMAKIGQSGQISLGPVVTAWEQDARLGCLTGGLGPGQLLNQSCDCGHMTRIPGLHSPGRYWILEDIDRWRCDCDRITRIPGLNSSEYHTNPLRYNRPIIYTGGEMGLVDGWSVSWFVFNTKMASSREDVISITLGKCGWLGRFTSPAPGNMLWLESYPLQRGV